MSLFTRKFGLWVLMTLIASPMEAYFALMDWSLWGKDRTRSQDFSSGGAKFCWKKINEKPLPYDVYNLCRNKVYYYYDDKSTFKYGTHFLKSISDKKLNIGFPDWKFNSWHKASRNQIWMMTIVTVVIKNNIRFE